MAGLLLKDFYNIRRQFLWYAGMTVLFCVLSVAMDNVAFSVTIGMLVTVSLPLAAFAYEERDGWQKFVVASGIDVRTIVGEKFLLGMLSALMGSAGALAVFLLVGDGGNSWAEFVLPLCLQFIVLAVVLPVTFKFGVERGRTYLILIVVACVALFVGLMSGLGEIMTAHALWISVAMAAAAAAVTAGSYFISVAICRRKQF